MAYCKPTSIMVKTLQFQFETVMSISFWRTKVLISSFLLIGPIASLTLLSNRYYVTTTIRMKSIKSYFSSTDEPKKKARIESPTQPEVKPVNLAEIANPSAPTDSSVSGSTTALSDIPDQYGWPPFDNLDQSWKSRLGVEYNKPYFKRLLQFLVDDSKTHIIYPPVNNVFSALNLCPYEKIKVVIIGQDPYHGEGQAHGLAFSVQKGIQIPPSLKNMINELQTDPKTKIPMPTHGYLACWSQQGVLMLNTVLTVRKAEANSHQKKG